MTIFDPQKFQDGPNGPLNKLTVHRLQAIKARTGLSYAALGARLGLSQAFAYNLINKAANVGTQHIERIATAIDALESPMPVGAAPASVTRLRRHTYHLRPELEIAIELPIDLTGREAERIGLFVRSLPVGE